MGGTVHYCIRNVYQLLYDAHIVIKDYPFICSKVTRDLKNWWYRLVYSLSYPENQNLRYLNCLDFAQIEPEKVALWA